MISIALWIFLFVGLLILSIAYSVSASYKLKSVKSTNTAYDKLYTVVDVTLIAALWASFFKLTPPSI